MNLEAIRKNTLENQTWLERALLVLDAKSLWHNESDQKTGSYMASWVRRQRHNGVKLGECLTGDVWPARARHLVKEYAKELLVLSLEKAKADAEHYKELAASARRRVRQLSMAVKALEAQKHENVA